jgi:hypothetical protein
MEVEEEIMSHAYMCDCARNPIGRFVGAHIKKV